MDCLWAVGISQTGGMWWIIRKLSAYSQDISIIVTQGKLWQLRSESLFYFSYIQHILSIISCLRRVFRYGFSPFLQAQIAPSATVRSIVRVSRGKDIVRRAYEWLNSFIIFREKKKTILNLHDWSLHLSLGDTPMISFTQLRKWWSRYIKFYPFNENNRTWSYICQLSTSTNSNSK